MYFGGVPPQVANVGAKLDQPSAKRPLKAEKCAENVAQTRDPKACAVNCAISAGGRKGKDLTIIQHDLQSSCPLRFATTCQSLRFHFKSGKTTGTTSN